MQGELAMPQSMPQLPPERERHTLVMPLDYEVPPEPVARQRTGLMLLVSAVRRLFLGTGVACVVGGAILMANPRADEEAVFIAIGLGMITASAPLPKWWG